VPFNRVILHQDRRVVETQIPKKTMLKMNENLVQGDLPIIQYRKRRCSKGKTCSRKGLDAGKRDSKEAKRSENGI
jgi:hypothetical protein